jgi:hypothetical protein
MELFRLQRVEYGRTIVRMIRGKDLEAGNHKLFGNIVLDKIMKNPPF